MKVLCVTNKVEGMDRGNAPVYPEIGEIYTVIKEQRKHDKLYYRLEELYEGYVYLSELFSPLSDIDELDRFDELFGVLVENTKKNH